MYIRNGAVRGDVRAGATSSKGKLKFPFLLFLPDAVEDAGRDEVAGNLGS